MLYIDTSRGLQSDIIRYLQLDMGLPSVIINIILLNSVYPYLIFPLVYQSPDEVDKVTNTEGCGGVSGLNQLAYALPFLGVHVESLAIGDEGFLFFAVVSSSQHVYKVVVVNSRETVPGSFHIR